MFNDERWLIYFNGVFNNSDKDKYKIEKFVKYRNEVINVVW